MKLLGTKELETNRLKLRRFTARDDLEMFNNWSSSKNVTKFTCWERHKNISDSQKLLKEIIDNYQRDDYFYWAIETKTTNNLIGFVSVVDLFLDDEACGLRFALGENYWNQGYTSEFLAAVIDYLFNKNQFKSIEAMHLKDNIFSGKAMQKVHMQKVNFDETSASKTSEKSDKLVYYKIINN